jgi:hypothetical protein
MFSQWEDRAVTVGTGTIYQPTRVSNANSISTISQLSTTFAKETPALN